jgi:Asp-tRNA(Asn)/Glu-tRNA(Gln) amidotransferase B subunit
MENKELVEQINKELAVTLPEKISMEELYEKLSIHINNLIQNNFEQLINLLYRIDISESKIRALLQTNPDNNAGNTIAALIIERQLQKIKSREQFRQKDENFTEEEKW